MERLQKILSAWGIASRRHAEELIVAGRVRCNGRVVALGDLADPARDRIEVDGRHLPPQPPKVYIMLNKPRGVLTTLSDERGRPTVAQLVADCGQRIWPVGRLDMDSEGLLLFTNDGAWSYALTHPKHEVDKTYLVWVAGFTQDRLTRLCRPVVLDGYRIRPPQVQKVCTQGDRTCLRVVIHEGRNRQIRRMCEIADLRVERLLREAEGGLSLGDLAPGQWRHLTSQEWQLLKGK